MSKEYKVEAIDVQNGECQSCKKGLKVSQYWVILLSFYMLITSIYGTVVLFKKLISLF